MNVSGKTGLQTRPGEARSEPGWVLALFYICGVFVVLPFFNIPLIGLSVTTPVMLPVIYRAMLQPVRPWLWQNRSWLFLSGAVWLGLALSCLANSPLFGQRQMRAVELAYVVRYLYWLTVFVVTPYVAAHERVQSRLTSVLAGSVVALAVLRCCEGLVFGKIGAWTHTVFTTQNSYGLLFSTFTPFLFPVFLRRGFLRKALCAAGLLTILYACAINGSRGSWICIALGFAVFVFLAVISHPAASLRLVLPVGIAVVAVASLLAASPRVRGAVLARWSTLDNLEMDKSYMSRQALNQKSSRLFAESPFFGVGPGRFTDSYTSLVLPDVFSPSVEDYINRKSSHNSYLGYLAEGGMAAFLPLALLLVVLTVRGAPAAAVLNRSGRHWGLGAYAGFAGMSVHLWALSGLTGTAPWFVYGLVAANVRLAAQSASGEIPQPAPLAKHGSGVTGARPRMGPLRACLLRKGMGPAERPGLAWRSRRNTANPRHLIAAWTRSGRRK